MVRHFLFIVGLFFSINVIAQTGIGTTTPHASAKLDVYSDNKGFLPPRVTLTGYMDVTTIPSPATGLLVYNTGSNANLAAGYYYWNGSAWATIATAGGSGSFAASFVRGSRTATQSVAAGGIVSFSSVDNSSGQDISLNTSNGKITLAPGNTYRLIAAVPTFTGGQRPSFMWYNENTSSYVGSASSTYNTGDAASFGAFGVISHVIITPSVSTVLSFRMLSSLNNGSVSIGGNSDFSTTGSYAWFEGQVISGNAPVTGQTVDYIQASLSANQALSAVGNINFNTFSGAGITITSGGFNLSANKTYKLEAAIGGAASSGYAYYGWVDNNNNLLPGGSIGAVIKAGNVHTDAPQDKAIVYFTPTVNTTVFLRVYNLNGTVTAYAPSLSTNYSSTWASIQQVGSSAFVNPWVLSGNNVYNTTGNVGIGNSAPTSTLDVTGSLAVSGATNLKNTLNVGTGVGLEGGEIDLATAALGSTTLTNGTVGLDVYGDKLRIFENGGNARGVYIDLGKAPIGVGGELLWKVNSTIQSSFIINATITAPILGTRSINQISYRLNGDKYRLTYRLGATGGTSHGSGDYLFNLPTGLTFNTASGYNPVYTGSIWSPNIASMAPYFIPVAGGLVMSGVWTMQMQIVPYNSTQFRVAIAASSGGYGFWSNGYFPIAQDMLWDAEFEIWAQ